MDAFPGRDGAEPDVFGSLDTELDLLTARERQVLRLIARGYSYKEVAGRLGISTKSVESQVSAVLRKPELSNRHQLRQWASERRRVCGRDSPFCAALVTAMDCHNLLMY